MAYFQKLDIWNYMNETGIGPILASTQCKFKIPLTYPDTVSVGTKISGLEADRFIMNYVVVSHEHAKVAAEGEGLVVSYDYRAQKKAALPDEIRERIKNLENSARQ